jgi:hypothetical protein
MSGIAPAVLRFRLVMSRFAIRWVSALKLALNGAVPRRCDRAAPISSAERGAEPGGILLPISAQKPFVALWRAPVSSTVIQAALSCPARST